MAAITTTGTATSTPDTVSASGTLSGTALGIDYFGTGAEIAVFIDFDAGVTDTPAAWVDVTGDIVIDGPIRIQRGRSSERDTFQTGTLTFGLLNTARKYDPEHTSGTYYGKLLPGRHVKVEMTYSATTTVLFYGFIQGWPQAWERSDNKSVVNIVAHDAFKYLALARLPESRWWAEIQADAAGALWGWWRLNEPDTEPSAFDASGNNYNTLYVPENSTSTSGLVEFGNNAARQAVDNATPITSALPIYCAGLEFTVSAWVRFPDPADWPEVATDRYIYYQNGADDTDKFIHFRIFRNSGLNSLLAWVAETSSSRVSITYNFPNSDLGKRHHVAFIRDGSGLTLYYDGVDVFSSGGGTLSGTASSFGFPAVIGGPSTTVNGTIVVDEVIVWQNALTGARIAAHYEAGSTVGAGETVDERITTALTDAGVTWLTTSLAASSVACRGADYQTAGSVLSYLQALEATERGRLFVAGDGTLILLGRYHDNTSTVAFAFTDATGGSLPYVDAEYEMDDTRVFNSVAVSRTNGEVKRAEDATSVAAYGLRSLTVDGLQSRSDNDSASIADHLVARYKDPQPRVRALMINPRSNPAALFPAVRDLEIGDKVTFRRLPLGTGSAYTKTLTVEGIAHEITVTGDWRTTLLTAPADPNTYLTLDSATLGQLDQEELGF